MEAAVATKLGPSTGPREKYFTRFATYFNSLDQEEKEKIYAEAADRIKLLAAEDEITRQFIEATKSFFSQFMAENNEFQRGDYLELARLIMVGSAFTIYAHCAPYTPIVPKMQLSVFNEKAG